jgi:hypothetical protein
MSKPFSIDQNGHTMADPLTQFVVGRIAKERGNFSFTDQKFFHA